jgi:hypothetical protein
MPEMERLPDRQTERVVDRGCAYPGNPGRPTAAMKRAAIEAEAEVLAEEFGGMAKLAAIDAALIRQAAALLTRRPRNGEDHVRVSNSIARLLSTVARRRGMRSRPAGPAVPSLGELLAREGR